MATPEAYKESLMDYAGNAISAYIRKRLSSDKRIVDIGAGWGKYRFLLPEYEMDCVEVWEPYVKENKLDAYYRKVFLNNIVDFELPQHYGAVTMGDVLEHIPKRDAWGVVEKLCNSADYVCIAVPFMMEQCAVEGNEHEEHKQPDLNEEVMAERYPQLELLESFGRPGEHIKAIYVKKGTK